MSSTSSYLSVKNAFTDSLINYVLDVKPYHTKLAGIVSQYLFDETISVKVTEDHKILAFLGADILPAELTTPGVRKRRSASWYKDIISDGARRIWPVPLTSVYKFASQANQEIFECGINDDYQIPGIAPGVFNPKRWDGAGITDVQLNGVHQQDSFDYFLSHGVYSFNTALNERWKETNVSSVPAFPENTGVLFYQKSVRPFGTIENITLGNFEEWTLKCIDSNTGELSVTGSSSGLIGTCLFGATFVSPLLTFDFTAAPTEFAETITIDDTFTLTPYNKITVAPTAPIETWSLIKTNPIALIGQPVFVPSSPRSILPALEIHARSLDYSDEDATWQILFAGNNTYALSRTRVSDGTITWSGIDLKDGCSFKNEFIHFTIIPTVDGFYAGDVYNFTTSARVENYLVYGSLSGWQPNAKIGEWYWNGKIGFKIPKLEYFTRVFNSTIIASSSGNNGSWFTQVSNNQELRNISFDNGNFFVAGNDSIIGASSNGIDWTSDLSTIYAPLANTFLTVVGGNGTIATSTDGITWGKRISGTTKNLKATTVIPDFLTALPYPPAIPGTLNCAIVVGESGTILTSINGIAWSEQVSGTTENLNDITWSNDAIIAIGNNGKILRSLDRLTWTTIPSGTTKHLNAIIHEPLSNTFIIVGHNGLILRSTDGGLTWADLNIFTDGTFSDVAYGLGKFVAVGDGGWTATSTDGITWTRYASKRLNSVAFGNGKFIAIGGTSSTSDQFVALKPVHSIAEPSVYTITFNSPTTASVYNNIYGFRRGLKANEDWSDEFVSFRLDSVPNVFEFQTGDVVEVFLTPLKLYPLTTGYDQPQYDISGYDTGVVEQIAPWLFNEEYFPLWHSNGSVIFKTCTIGDEIIINKAFKDALRFRIQGADAVAKELASADGWIPLEFRYFDRLTAGVPSSEAHFSNLTTYIEAYLAGNSDQRVFSIVQPRYEKTDRNASALLTFDAGFFSQYMKFSTKYSLVFLPDEVYGQRIRVKITENLHSYARIRLEFADISIINIDESTIQHWDMMHEMGLSETIDVLFTEGGALPVANNYDQLPFDIHAYDQKIYNGVIQGVTEISPGVYDYTGDPEDWVMPKPTSTPSTEITEQALGLAAAQIAESLFIVDRIPAGPIDRLSAYYYPDTVLSDSTPAMQIDLLATEYLITYAGMSGSPTLIVESLANLGVYGNPPPNLNVYNGAPTALSSKSFKFVLPIGFTAPFKLTVV